MVAPRIAALGLALLVLGCLSRRGDGGEPTTAAGPSTAAEPDAQPNPAGPAIEARNTDDAESVEIPPVTTAEGSPEPCAALGSCCKGTEGEALCLEEAGRGEPLQCVLSIYWAYCPGQPRPDVDGGEHCFRTKDGCHASLLTACRVQGCDDPQASHGCYLTGDDRRQVGCGNW